MNKTKIQWTEETWNPITGCTKISDGCQNCYAERMAKRLKCMGNIKYNNEFTVTVHNSIIEAPKNDKKSKIIFVNSMSDLFHENVSEKDICRIFKTMNDASWHIFQVLTKRPERLVELDKKGIFSWTENIWMGVSVENDKYINRIELLKETKAENKFVSFEPLIGSVGRPNLDGIDWAIVGGESGPGCRPIDKEWIIEIKDCCREYEIPFFFKQWGGINKKKSGRILDGKEYNEFPKALK